MPAQGANDWWCRPTHSARLREIFDRGYYFEGRSQQLLSEAGFKFAPPEALAFSTVNVTEKQAKWCAASFFV
jgi:hypothetical protein